MDMSTKMNPTISNRVIAQYHQTNLGWVTNAGIITKKHINSPKEKPIKNTTKIAIGITCSGRFNITSSGEALMRQSK
jgi:hypothetical protein